MTGRALAAQNITRIRIKEGISQEKLAADAGVDRSRLSGLERQVENPTVNLLDRVAAALIPQSGTLYLWNCSPAQSSAPSFKLAAALVIIRGRTSHSMVQAAPDRSFSCTRA
jgi:transcriptional regulator with XRE-family HTH domain